MATRTQKDFTAGEVLTAADVDDDLSSGWLGYVEVTANQATITSVVDLTSLTLTVTVNTSRRIKITSVTHWTASNNSNSARVQITDGSNTVLQTGTACVVVLAQPETIQTSVILTPSSGSNTWKLRGLMQNGTGSVTLNASSTSPSYILVEDIGPAS